MAAFAGKREIDIWYDRVDVDRLVAAIRELPSGKGKSRGQTGGAEPRRRFTGTAAKARLRDAWSAIEKITEVVDGQRRFRDQPPLLTRLDIAPDAAAQINALFREYRATLQDDRQELLKRYEIIDMGHKVVGVGSVGLLAFVLLLRGRDEDDLMVLQVKQAQASVLEAYTRKSAFSKHGHRVVTGQRLMQAASDSFLGWIDGPAGRSYYVRQLRDMKWSPDPATLNKRRIGRYAILCGHTLARAHARSGDAIAISAYLGKGKAFDKAITAFAESYADQTERDFAAFTSAIADGRLSAHEDDGGAEGIRAAQRLKKRTATRKRSTRKRTPNEQPESSCNTGIISSGTTALPPTTSASPAADRRSRYTRERVSSGHPRADRVRRDPHASPSTRSGTKGSCRPALSGPRWVGSRSSQTSRSCVVGSRCSAWSRCRGWGRRCWTGR